MGDKPLLLVGCERSGTTLLRLMLDSHPDIAFVEEFEYSLQLVDGNRLPSTEQFAQVAESSRIFQTSGFAIDHSQTYPDLIKGFLEQRRAAKGAAHVGATIHYGYTKAPTIWPDARYIHIVRDPRDVAPSIVKMGWDHDVWNALDKWVEAEEDWKRFSPGLEADQHITVYFEDLINSHVHVLKRLCSFIGVEFTEEMLRYADDTDYKVPAPGEAGNWRNTLPSADVQLVESRVADLMVSCGYELSGLPVLEPSQARMLWLKVSNKLRHHKHRADRYGLALHVKHIAAGRLGLEAMQHEAQAAVNEIERSHLKRSWRGDIGDHSSAR